MNFYESFIYLVEDCLSNLNCPPFIPEDEWKAQKPDFVKWLETLRDDAQTKIDEALKEYNLKLCEYNLQILEKGGEEAKILWLEIEKGYTTRSYYQNNKTKFQYSRLRKLLGSIKDKYPRSELEWVCRNCQSLKKFSDELKKNPSMNLRCLVALLQTQKIC